MSPPAAERPRVVHIACTLWIIGMALGLIGQYLLSPLTDLTAARTRVLASTTSGLTRQQIDTAVTLSVVGALAFAIVLAVVDGLVDQDADAVLSEAVGAVGGYRGFVP